MAIVNDMSGAITALYKFYHADRTRFYPTVTAAVEYPDEMYAVTLAPSSAADTAASCMVRFVRSSTGTWMTKQLLDVVDTAAIGIMSSVQTGQFARMAGKTYYTNGDSPVKQIRSRQSSQDTAAKFLYPAGIPDPNAKKIFDVCETTGNITYDSGDGAGSAGVSRSVQTRRFGRGSMEFTQAQPDSTSSITITAPTDHDWTTFDDGVTASGSDYFAMSLFRYDKNVIAQVRIDLFSTTTADVFTAYCAVTGSTTNLDGTTWDNWHPIQTVVQAKWANSPYDNEMFPVRIRKDHFGGEGSPLWNDINSVRVSLKSRGNASSTRPARIAVNNIRLLKSPPVITSNRVQCATFEHTESDSTYGWLVTTATFTKPTFNYNFAREGAACIAVAEGQTAKLKFDGAAKNFLQFPDGSNVDSSCVLRCNCTWKPLGFVGAFDWAATFTAPVITFTDGSAQTRSVTMMGMGDLQGGGVVKQQLWKTGTAAATAPWSGSAAFDWDDVVQINITGPTDSGLSPTPFYFDDMRFERPYDAQQPVYIFEPIERYAIDAATEFLGAQFKDMEWVIDLGGEVLKFIFSNLSYQTYGMGFMKYPDHDHSSIGLAGCTLTTYGSKPFGARFRFTGTHDLTSYRIPTINWPPSWSNFPDEMGPIKWESIPAGADDKYSIWLATPPEQLENLDRLTVRFYGDNGGAIDQEVYMEYSISGLELTKITKAIDEDKAWQKQIQSIQSGIEHTQSGTSEYGSYQDQFYGWTAQMGMSFLRGDQKDLTKQLIQGGIKHAKLDRGGWPSATFEWKRKDMITVENSAANRQFDMSAVRGIGIEVIAKGGGTQICVDNLMMMKEGNLNGEYIYAVMLEDREGNLSPMSELSQSVRINKGDAVLTDIYTPTAADQLRISNKQIYRIGGFSNEIRFVGNCAVANDTYYDSLGDDKAGRTPPEDAFAPPKCKSIKAINNVMYYANITEDRSGEVWPYRVMCSQPFVPYRVSDFKAVDLNEDKGGGIVAIEGYYGKVIMWTPDSMWSCAEFLQGVPVRRNGKGCIARDSVALSDYGIIWLSRDGLILGDISKVDDNFFKPINPLFESFTEDELADAKGFVLGQYYYLFYNFDAATGTGDGICCYLPERTFSELDGPFDITSFCRWDGGPDANDIYYGRNNGKIYKLFSGDTDDGTAIVTTLRTRDFSHPGIQYEKWLRAYYLSIANIGAVDSTVTPKVYVNETTVETMPIWTATTTTVQTLVQPAIQGDRGTHIGMALSGSGTYKITEMVLKVEIEDDVEYKP